MRTLRFVLVTTGLCVLSAACDRKVPTEADSLKPPEASTEKREGSPRSGENAPAPVVRESPDEGDTPFAKEIATASGEQWSELIGKVLALENTQERRQLLTRIMMEIRNREPSSNSLFINALPIGHERIELLSGVVGLSRIGDLVEILNEITKSTAPRLETGDVMQISNFLIHALSDVSAADINRILPELPTEFQRTAVTILSRKYGEDSNVESFSRILEEHSASAEDSSRIARSFFNEYAQKAPAESLRLIEKTDFPTEAILRDAVGSALGGIFNVNRTLALSSAMEIDVPDAVRTEAFTDVANRWTGKAIEEFSAKALTLPKGLYRDIAAEQIVGALRADEQVERQRWLDFIEDPERRKRVEESLPVSAPP